MRATICLLALLMLAGPAFAQEKEESVPLADREINLTVDQVVTWLALGILVGFVVLVVGNIGQKKTGRGTCILFGLIGATAGIFLVNALRIDLQLGAIVIYYDTLLVSAATSFILFLAVRFLSDRGKKS